MKPKASLMTGPMQRCMRGVISTGMVVLLTGAALVAIAGVWLGTGLIASDRWPVQWVRVEGEFRHISAEQLRTAVAAQMDDGFFAVELDEVRRAAENLPWVEEARVRKHWPDTVEVRVLEHQPAANFNDGKLINTNGVVFELPDAVDINGLPNLRGPEDRALEVFQTWQSLSQALVAAGLDVTAVTLSDRGTWDIEATGGLQIRLGAGDPVQRIARFVNVYDELVRAGPPMERIDLRYSNGIAVKRQQVENLAAEIEELYGQEG